MEKIPWNNLYKANRDTLTKNEADPIFQEKQHQSENRGTLNKNEADPNNSDNQTQSEERDTLNKNEAAPQRTGNIDRVSIILGQSSPSTRIEYHIEALSQTILANTTKYATKTTIRKN